MIGERLRRKKTTIFRIFLIPLIGIMLIQSMITIGTLVARKTPRMLEEYSIGMMGRLVENRKVILQNDMNQRWASIREQEALMEEVLERYLKSEGVGIEECLRSDTLKNGLLELLFPECLEILQNNYTTGIFCVLTGNDIQAAGDFDGFFIRDSDPNTNPVNYTDLLLERGSKQLSRRWNIPLDTGWTTRFHMDGQGKNAADNYFYEPWRAGVAYGDADTKDLGYWSTPFCLDKKGVDPHEMITYSLPLRYGGRVYGVLGVEISGRMLADYFPVTELSSSGESGYLLAFRNQEDAYVPLMGKGVLSNLVGADGNQFWLEKTKYDTLFRVRDIQLNKQRLYAVVCPLKLYSNNVPYENTDWVLLGLNTQEELFGMSRRLYVWMVIAILVGLIFGVFGISILVKYLTRPVQRLMQCIKRGSAGLREYTLSNILEVDALYHVVRDLTERQKEVENILLEEKERYKVALESSKDIFFSYDFTNHVLDIVNHETMSGQWQCDETESGFIALELIHESDRKAAIEALRSKEDRVYVEFRLGWPENVAYKWVALSGKAVYDTEGRRRKLVGSIRNIQEQKEKEARERRKNRTDGVTGLYVYGVGMECLQEYRRQEGDGVMIHLLLQNLKESNEKNGIIFGDMILEEIGSLLRNACGKLTSQKGHKTVALRLNGDEFVLWLEKQSGREATAFIEALLKKIVEDFPGETFPVRMSAGMVCVGKETTAEEAIRMAKLAQEFVVSDAEKAYYFYEDIREDNRRMLPALDGREINTLDYGEDVSLVSVALNLFGKGADFPAQMALMVRKIGRFYQAEDVLVSILRPDFNTNYLEYQWHRDKTAAVGSAGKYKEAQKELFSRWLGKREVKYFSGKDSEREEICLFLNAVQGKRGIVLPLYESGNYMGNICILEPGLQFLESPEEYQNLAELGRVIQNQLNQQQYDIASKAKSEFLSRMSHEIRTPMNGIIGMAAIALQQGQDRERMTDCLQKIQASSGYLLGLINDILDMSKIESGKMKLELFHFSMQEMLDTVREMIAPQVDMKEITFTQQIELKHSWFFADRMRISQVLINLLGNAVKFTPQKGRITLTVREGQRIGDKIPVFFAVKDTGIGIAKEDQERVFRSFEQSGGIHPAKQQGTGLGLSISNRLIQMMGSNILLDSQVGAGSTFSFTIALEPGQSKEKENQKEAFSFDGCHVLVVEDNELNAEIAQSLLEERNFKVDCVYDGAQAVERIRNTPPGTYDVVLMDIMMPVMDGLEATRAIRSMQREDCHTLPIVAMSANAFDDDLKKSVECGMNGHLSKPVEVDKLYRVLREVIYG